MILVQFKNAWYAAVIVCDICQQRISDGGLAVAVFRHIDHESSELLPVLHAHKGPCQDAAEAKLGGKENTGQEELANHLLQMAHNSGLSPEALIDHRKAYEIAHHGGAPEGHD
jgi:hypothetical protein